ncbi:hypothetical protein GCM10023172_11640 [Hymenobacter ginsengisoli]|uniref:Uncharacterized protein n=1 Tax=Hymenobacter ginsengisoli TaxID=1051626 RepID=A0ABP8Q3R0_9BACT|nr:MULTISPECIES: hypothetical protein [unclassified Hymenobacter]MBO2031751.1 hypothetical protein [Hymenobacter sp. BT559]
MKNLLFLALWLLRPWAALAQDASLATRPDSLLKVNVVGSGRYTHWLYSMNGEPVTSSTLKKLLAKYPESAVELHKYRAQKRNALLLLPVFVASTIVGGLAADQQRDKPGSNFSKAPLPFSISLAAFFGSIALAVSNDHYEKAIEAYNGHFHKRQAVR